MDTKKFLKLFYRYEKVRRSGKYNMITEAVDAAKAANLDLKEYRTVIHSYSNISNMVEMLYGSVDKFMKEFKE